MAGLILEGIVQRFGDHTVLHGIDLTVDHGEFMVLVGPSGCGKSTLLRIVAGLVPATEGRLELDGRPLGDLEPRERDVAMVFQNYALYPHMSVRKNLAFPLTLRREPRAQIAEKVRKTAHLLGLEELLDRKPKQLSGGQMQRVAVGRAIIRNPRLFLFDEPLSNLDAKLRAEMRGEISRLHQDLGITTLYVTHDQAEAMTLGQRICVLRDGHVEQIGEPIEVFRKPATRFVASFIGSPAMNLLEGQVEGGIFARGDLQLSAPGLPDGPVCLGVRPHRVEPGGPHALEVRGVERLGTQTLIDLKVEEATLRLSVEGQHPARRGERLEVSLPPGALHWFDAGTGHRIEPSG